MDMRDSSQARFTLPTNANRKRVPGLRDEAPNSEVKVYKMNPDGSKGQYLRTEPAFYTHKGSKELY